MEARSHGQIIASLDKSSNRANVSTISLNDPIDTTNTQGKLMFNIFAFLAEFEKDLIRKRTIW